MKKTLSFVLALAFLAPGVGFAAPKATPAKAAAVDKGLDDLLSGELKQASTRKKKKPLPRKPMPKLKAGASKAGPRIRNLSPAERKTMREKARAAEKLLLEGK